MTSQQLPDREEIPIIDPGTVSPPTAAKSALQNRRRDITTPIVLAIAFLLLIATTICVIFFLPDMVEKKALDQSRNAIATNNVSPPESQKITTATRTVVTAPQTDAESAKSRAEAEQALGLFLQKRNALEVQAVSLWGGGDYIRVIELEKTGDRFFKKKYFDAARQDYTNGLEILSKLEKTIPKRISDTITEGSQALEKGDAKQALNQFTLAAKIEPSNNIAQRGILRSKINQQVFELLNNGLELENQNRLSDARNKYQQAATLDPELKRVKNMLASVNGKLTEQEFRTAMSQGFNYLSQENYSTALNAFKKAENIKPGSEQVNEGLIQAREGIRLGKITLHKRKAQRFEKSENWKTAAEHYRAALAIDPTLQFAKQGRERSLRNAELHRQLDFYLDKPSRLHSKDPYQSAAQLLLSLRDLPSKGMLLSKKTRNLSTQLELARTEYPVRLKSDAQTDIAVYKLGKLGKFTSHRLMLRPGTYTVVGTRSGYRDVRQKFTVDGQQNQITIEIQCREKI